MAAGAAGSDAASHAAHWLRNSRQVHAGLLHHGNIATETATCPPPVRSPPPRSTFANQTSANARQPRRQAPSMSLRAAGPRRARLRRRGWTDWRPCARPGTINIHPGPIATGGSIPILSRPFPRPGPRARPRPRPRRPACAPGCPRWNRRPAWNCRPTGSPCPASNRRPAWNTTPIRRPSRDASRP
ncbi:hypothetical protein AMP9_0628 [plant metagenome]|uniref:Uncharacterized protein n=1 Tax=plant metagenome TaxID=1297885 RepID=A0A484NU30_9ZZZZ